MTLGPHSSERFRTVVVGGGVAALEACLALRYLTGEHVEITMITPRTDFTYRPLTVREPFSGPVARRYPIRRFAEDLELTLELDTVAGVDTDERTVLTASGSTVPYDALLLAPGAITEPRYEHALNLDDRKLDQQLHGLVQDVEGGAAHRVAFVVPPGPSWPLPIYELALMTAERAYDMSIAATITIITPEYAPLAVFGPAASQAVERELTRHRIVTLTSSACEVTGHDRLLVHPDGRELQVDRIVALPHLRGPAIPGVPATEHGFLVVDRHSAVNGIERVFAAGDATEYPVKQGNIAAQQADAAAEAIAALAGASIDPQPIRPVLHGILLGARPPLYLRARLTDGQGVDSEASTEPLWDAPNKIDTRYLSQYLERIDSVSEPATTEA